MSSPHSCRILTISSTATGAKELAERIITASNSADKQEEGTTSPLLLPWTISNKYYTAPVHFSIAQTAHVKSEDAVEIPACIFVFSLTQAFKAEFISLISSLENSDFEVSIAVSLPSTHATETTEDEQDALEAFFGEYGFEYVNGHSPEDSAHEYDHNIASMQGIPGIGRIVDALSTILWPSMIQQASSRRAKARSVVSVPGPPGEEDSLRALLKVDNDTSREIAALEKWLEEGADDEKDPWAGAQSLSPIHAGEGSKGNDISLPESGFNDTFGNSKIRAAEGHSKTESGFDDNFSDFVSAPAQRHTHAEVDVGEDPALPSQSEVESMSRRIFGTASIDDVDDGDSQTPFDLSRVLGALEAMKEEIAGISDEDEKRRAAAKVALGLVYGLEEG